MKRRHAVALTAVAVAVVFAGVAAARSTLFDGATTPSAAAKRCKMVVKRVDGRPRRVQVCQRERRTVPSPVIARIDVGAESWTVAAADDRGVWSDGATGVLRIDPATNRIALRTNLQGAAGAGAGSIWVTSGRTVRRLDPVSGAVQAEIALPHEGESAFALLDAVWVTAPDERALMRFHPRTGAIVATVPACDVKVHGLAATDGALWAACYIEGEVLRIDPAANRVVARINVGYGVHSLASGAGSVWATNHETGKLTKIDAATNAVVATLATSINPAIVFALDAVWVSGRDAVLKIDPATNRIAGRLPVGSGEYYGLAYSAGSLWMSTIGERRVLRLDPARLRRP